MNSTLHLGDGLRDDLIRVFCYVGLPFIAYFLYVDWTYNRYLEEYRNSQKQEVQTANEKITSTLIELRTLTEALRMKILATPEDSLSIQTTLKAGQLLSQRYAIPTIQNISYYKLSHPQAVITPTLIAPLNKVPRVFRKPAKALEALTYQNNALVGTLPVLDKNKRLKGVIEVKEVPSLDLQKIIGADHFKTLEFPQLFEIDGAKFIQKKPLEFIYKSPLSYLTYLNSYASHFWLLVFAVLLGGPLVFFSGRIAKKRVGFVYGSQISQLNAELESLNTHQSSLEVDNSFLRHIIQRSKELAGVIHKVVTHIGASYGGSNKVLMSEVEKLAQALSSGLWPNLQRKPLILGDILNEVKMHFANQIQNLNLKWNVTELQDLTIVGDPLFAKIVLLNAIGVPLYSTPKNGALLISVMSKNGFAHIEVRDNRYSLTNAGKQYLKIPLEFFVEAKQLRQLCIQNGVGYESYETKGGGFITKVSFALEPDEIAKGNVISFPR
ncbi:MAG: hypothetical protein K2X28_07785 [Alphaproteobacteria bacterium]|nr:hypothetical protein [Alphaproteobacteria bacterium]